MKFLKTIRDSDLGMNYSDPAKYKERRAARAVVFDREKKIALLHATKKHFHKLPGGGADEGESIEMTLRREILEEIGCAIDNLRELGIIIEEYRNQYELHQLSYCFLADIVGEKGIPKFEDDEIADGFEPVWMSLEDAVKTIESETAIEDYEGKFIHVRDLAFLQAATRL